MEKKRERFLLLMAVIGLLLLMTGCSKSNEYQPYEARSEEELQEFSDEAHEKSIEIQSARDKAERKEGYSTENFDKGNEHYKNGDYGKAIEAYDKHLEEVPGDWVAMNNKGLSQLEEGDNEEAFKTTLLTAKMYGSEHPECLVNYLVAGHAMRFSPKMLLDKIYTSNTEFNKAITKSGLKAEEAGKLMDALKYNVLYMNMEIMTENGETKSTSNLNNIEQYLEVMNVDDIYKILETMADKGDEDAEELKDYFTELMKVKEIE